MNNGPFFCAIGLVVLLFIIPTIIVFTGTRGGKDKNVHENEDDNTLVVFVTATMRSASRLADMTSLANTLRHEDDVVWIVVDNSTEKSELLDSVIRKAQHPYTYLIQTTANSSDWTLRNEALAYIRNSSEKIKGDYKKAVVYFGDADYAYDVRFWDSYLKAVNTVGIWDVGRSYDRNTWNKNDSTAYQYFDLANFATSMDLITNSNVTFNEKCDLTAVELCFIRDLKLKKSDIQQFQEEGTASYLIWHAPRDIPTKLENFSLYNYTAEVA